MHIKSKRKKQNAMRNILRLFSAPVIMGLGPRLKLALYEHFINFHHI
jgi:hypothetical protein